MSHPRTAFRPPLALSIIAVSTAVLSLTACSSVTLTGPEPAPSASVSEAVDPTVSPSPTPTPSASVRPAVLPTDCSKVVSAASYDGFFLGTPLNDPGFVDPSLVGPIAPVPPPAGATPAEVVDSAIELRCIWRDPRADITGLAVEYSRVDAAIAAQHLEQLAAGGYTCTDTNGGQQCQLVSRNEQYPVDEGHTVLARDGVVIDVWQANFPTVNLMAALTATVWGG